MLGFVVGYFCFVGLLILKVPFAPALATFAAVTELIPTLGPWIGGAAAVIVTLAVAPDKALWVAVIFLIDQTVTNVQQIAIASQSIPVLGLPKRKCASPNK